MIKVLEKINREVKIDNCRSARAMCSNMEDACETITDAMKDYGWMIAVPLNALIVISILTQTWWLCWFSVIALLIVSWFGLYSMCMGFLFGSILWDYFYEKEVKLLKELEKLGLND